MKSRFLGALGIALVLSIVLGVTAYTDQFYNAESALDIVDAFEDLVNRIVTPAYQPITGTNSAGSDNAVTYSDPIGD